MDAKSTLKRDFNEQHARAMAFLKEKKSFFDYNHFLFIIKKCNDPKEFEFKNTNSSKLFRIGLLKNHGNLTDDKFISNFSDR